MKVVVIIFVFFFLLSNCSLNNTPTPLTTEQVIEDSLEIDIDDITVADTFPPIFTKEDSIVIDAKIELNQPLPSYLLNIDTIVTYSEDISDASSYEELKNAKFDTTTLKGKRAYIMNSLILELFPSGPQFYALFDLNYDGYEDYIIGYYGQAGTGIKNGVEVYLFKKSKKSYVRNSQLSEIRNPTFYIKKKKITGFYIANSSGDGSQLEWINGQWVETKTFSVLNEEKNSVWHIKYPLKHKEETLSLPYQYIPPKEILETNF